MYIIKIKQQTTNNKQQTTTTTTTTLNTIKQSKIKKLNQKFKRKKLQVKKMVKSIQECDC